MKSKVNQQCFICLLLSEIDNDGVIEADTDEPQEMGAFENIEVKWWASQICNHVHIQKVKDDFTTSDRICLNISVDTFPQVTEEMMDQANEKKMDAINAQGEGMVNVMFRNCADVQFIF